MSVQDKLIGVNGRHHPHRQRFSICHEIGHILLGHLPESRCSPAEIKAFNEEADACAGELLMPEPLLAPLVRQRLDLKDLSSRFDVSQDALLRRIRSLPTSRSSGQRS